MLLVPQRIGAVDHGGFGEQRLGFGERVTVQPVETPCDLSHQLDVGHLVDANRDLVGLIENDVGCL